MKIQILTALLWAISTAFVSAAPSPDDHAVSVRQPEAVAGSNPIFKPSLEKRKGGFGGGGKGGGSSGGKGGKGGSGGGKPASSYSFSPSSNAGGRTRDGSGPPPAYPGGRYIGGAKVPYTAGARSPTLKTRPLGLGTNTFPFFPAPWDHPVYAYRYPIHYNHTHPNGTQVHANTTCLCQCYGVCGCDPTFNATFLNDLINNGTSGPVNSSTVVYATFPNGTEAAFINGTLPNGTTAGGGSDPSNASEIGGARGLVHAQAYAGYWAVAATVVAAVMAT